MPDRGWRPAGGVLVALVVVGLASPAGAAERLRGDELRALAGRASSDPLAVRELRQVREVDGRPVDLRRALEGADRDTLRARLRALAHDAGGGAVATPTSARRDALRILEGRKFQPARTPRPLRGALRRIGGWLGPVLEPLGRLWSTVSASTLGRVAVAVAVIAVATVASLGLVRRRSRAGVERVPSGRRRRRVEDPAELEGRADAAERAGHLEEAVRLRFRAGLIRLDEAGALAYRPSLTTGELTRRLRSSTFDDLAAAFDEIAYGGRPASGTDLTSARQGWARVLEEAGSR